VVYVGWRSLGLEWPRCSRILRVRLVVKVGNDLERPPTVAAGEGIYEVGLRDARHSWASRSKGSMATIPEAMNHGGIGRAEWMSRGRTRHSREAMLAVTIQGPGHLDPELRHDHEAHAVDEALLPAVLALQDFFHAEVVGIVRVSERVGEACVDGDQARGSL
jgi:hypothetical protein